MTPIEEWSGASKFLGDPIFEQLLIVGERIVAPRSPDRSLVIKITDFALSFFDYLTVSTHQLKFEMSARKSGAGHDADVVFVRANIAGEIKVEECDRKPASGR